VYDLKGGKVLEILETRKKRALKAWFRKQPEWWRRAIRVACIDMWGPYEQAIREVFGDQVSVVADKFHVVKQLNDRITQARRRIQREAPDPVKDHLKGIRWAILKDRSKLSGEEKEGLDRAFGHSPALQQMYGLKQEFLRIYRYKREGGGRAIRRLRGWMQKVLATELPDLHAFVRTLSNWWDEVMAYFRTGKTNAGAEGMNTMIKLVMRRGYGFRNHQHFRFRILQETGTL
jgi:transposase